MLGNQNIALDKPVDKSSVLYDPNSQQTSMCKCCAIKFSSPFSNITSKQVAKRLLYALVPFKSDFFKLTEEGGADLYGPFWIYATLIFCLAAAGNFSKYIQYPSGYAFQYDFNYLPSAFFLVYLLGFGIPLLMFLIMKLFQMNYTLTQTMCLYGYSCFVFIPISWLCIIDSETFKWIILVYGFCSSICFMVMNYWKDAQHLETKNKITILVIVIILQLIVLFLYKYYFFNQVYAVNSLNQTLNTSLYQKMQYIYNN